MMRPTGTMLLARGVRQLTEAGVPGAATDARRLFSRALGLDTGRLTLALPEPVSEATEAIFASLLQRRCAREPVSHLLGYRDFYGRRFKVTADVLDPRPETETLIEVSLRETYGTVLDLGTGSGAILLSLLAEMPQARGFGLDLCPLALAVAQDNATAFGLTDRAELLVSDWYDALPRSRPPRFDLIVANPPYVALDEMAGLAPEVRDWEPWGALTDGADGLAAYWVILSGHAPYLRPGGRIAVEIGAAQGREVSAMFVAAGLQHVEVVADLDGRDRVVVGRNSAA